MINLGYSKAEVRQLKKLLYRPHWIKITIQILDMEHRHLSTVSNMLISGQVDYDTSSDPTRSLEMVLFDPRATISTIPGSPEKSAMFVDNMVRVIYSIAPPDKSKWYDIPVFTGPVKSVARSGFNVSVRAHGKEILGLGTPWKRRSFRRGHKVVTIVRYILEDVMGEAPKRISLPNKKRTVGKDVNVSSSVVPWALAKKLANSIEVNLFYDGRGNIPNKKHGKKPVVVFGPEMLSGEPSFTFDPSTLINAVEVIGGKPKNSKRKVAARAVAPDAHPLSPRRLGRNGVPRYMVHRVEDSSLRTDRACKKMAKDLLERFLIQSLTVEAQVLPFPMLEEGDPFTVKTDTFTARGRATKWSLPLTHDGLMTLGYNKRVSFPVRKKKQKSAGKNAGASRNGRG